MTKSSGQICSYVDVLGAFQGPQDHQAWKGTLEIIYSNPLLPKQGSPGADDIECVQVDLEYLHREIPCPP